MKKIIVIALALVLCFSFGACGSPSPTEVANDFLEGIKTQNSDAIKAVYAGDGFDLEKSLEEESDDEFDKVFGDTMYDKLFAFEYEVSNEKIDGDKATVDVTIKTYSLGTAFTSFVNDYMAQAFSMALSGASEEAIENKAVEILSAKLEESKMDYEKTVTLNLSQKEGEWVIDEIPEDGDFYNALTGGMIDAAKDIEGMFGTSDGSSDK